MANWLQMTLSELIFSFLVQKSSKEKFKNWLQQSIFELFELFSSFFVCSNAFELKWKMSSKVQRVHFFLYFRGICRLVTITNTVIFTIHIIYRYSDTVDSLYYYYLLYFLHLSNQYGIELLKSKCTHHS